MKIYLLHNSYVVMSYVRDKLQSNGHYHTIYDVILKGFLYDNEQLIVHDPSFYYMTHKQMASLIWVESV